MTKRQAMIIALEAASAEVEGLACYIAKSNKRERQLLTDAFIEIANELYSRAEKLESEELQQHTTGVK